MRKSHVKKGDEVVVIAGAARGRRARVRLAFPRKSFVVLEALDDAKEKKEGEDEEQKAVVREEEKRKMIKPTLHYLKKSQQNPQGGLVWMEGSIHISNVMLATEFDARAARHGGTESEK